MNLAELAESAFDLHCLAVDVTVLIAGAQRALRQDALIDAAHLLEAADKKQSQVSLRLANAIEQVRAARGALGG